MAESEKRLRSVLETVALVAITLDTQGRLTFCNDFFLDLTGWKREEVVGEDWFDTFVPAEIKDELKKEVFLKTIESGEFPAHHENEILTKSGERRLIAWSNTAFFNEKVSVLGVTSIGEDITDRRKAEEQLRDSETFFREITENASDIILIVDEKGIIAYTSPSVERFLGYRPDGLIGKSVFDFIHSDDIERALVNFTEAVQMEMTAIPNAFRVLHKDGSERVLEGLGKNLLHHPIVSGFIMNVHDVTESRRLQNQVRESQKTKAIATLAGGIAHEFNNALSSITGYTELLEMDYPQSEKIAEYAKVTKQSAHRMALLTSQLLAYAGGGKYDPHSMSLSKLVEGALPLIQHTLDPDIRLETDFPLDVLNVEVDRTQMQMVLSAIVANSNEAIEPPGRIRISTRNMDLDQGSIKDHPGLKPGPHVYLSIEDDGKGMDEETRERIFEPFFTTHFMGRGLGMASVYGIIANHDGSISVDSEPGKGTTVKIYLPAIEAKEEVEERTVSTPAVDLPTGEGTVLVIEDEAPLLKMNRQILERCGYRVLEARNGKEAVELARTFDGRIDLALLDIKLPDMSGNRSTPLSWKPDRI